jgi:transposase
MGRKTSCWLAAVPPVCALLIPVPGLGRLSIDVIIAETGADMSRFPTAGDLASWAGVCPGDTRLSYPYVTG